MKRKTRASTPAPPPPPEPVKTVRPDPEVWSIALEWAGGDASRLRVLDERCVKILNR